MLAVALIGYISATAIETYAVNPVSVSCEDDKKGKKKKSKKCCSKDEANASKACCQKKDGDAKTSCAKKTDGTSEAAPAGGEATPKSSCGHKHTTGEAHSHD